MLRRILMAAVVLLVVLASVSALLKLLADRNFYAGYSADYPLNAVAGTPEFVQGEVKAFGQVLPARYKKISLTYEAVPGESVPTIMTLPMDAEANHPLPAIILIHGSHQEKEFLEEICTPFNEAGFAMACFDQYMRGDRKTGTGVLDAGLAFRERCRKTVHEVQRLMDYLGTRPDIDSRRIYLIGASYGAITGTVAVARDKRIRAAALVVGGGNWRILAKAPEVRRSLPRWMWPFAGSLMKLIAGPADPILHAPQTGGTPILMLNGSNDSVVTPESGKALYDALGEPKEIRWYPVDHPDREKKGEEVIKMLNEGLEWMLVQDAPYRDEASEKT